MISYARNREDVLLNRLFGDRSEGFFIDVGAGHPNEDSSTRHFYDLGWRGLNLEPSPRLFSALESSRPEDINLQVALSDRPGSMDFYEFHPTYWHLSTLSESQAQIHASKGIPYVTRSVRVDTLARVCEQQVRGEIQFMSIDVEGYEARVIAGGDWSLWRPRVLVVESTRPTTQIATHESWEPILLEAGYLFAYFDGLNRFYVRSEDESLLEFFKVPVNVFDRYETYDCRRRTDELELELAAARAVNEDLEQSNTLLHAEHLLFRDRFRELEARYHDLASSVAETLQPGPDLDVGPLAHALARRITAAAIRHPRLAGVAHLAVRLGTKLRDRLKAAERP